MMNQDIFLPYGLDAQAEIVHVSEVESGQTDLTCPFCKEVLVAKKGARLSHHFAHAENTCKEALGENLEKISPNIPFYDSFFSTSLSATEKRSVKILYEKFGLSLFYRKGKLDSAFQILYLNDILKISQVWENLESANYIQQRGNWYHLTKLAELGLALLPLSEFTLIQEQRLHFYESFLDTGTSSLDMLRKKVYDNLKTRLLSATLYCLHIPSNNKEADAWKIGITTRSTAHRLQELLPVIKHKFGEKRAISTKVAIELPGLGRLEAYIKKRFAHANLPIEFKGQVYTEFFNSQDLFKELGSLS